MRSIKLISQHMQTECGLCCIAMIANYYHHYITLDELRQYQQPGRDGVSAKQLCRILDWIGFEYKAYKSNFNGLKQIRLPAIAFCDDSHFVVVEKISKSHVIAMDPGGGRTIFSHDEFNDCYSGIAISPYPKETTVLAQRPRKQVRELFSALHLYKLPLFGVLVFSIVTYATSLYIPTIIQKMIDTRNSISTTLLFSVFLTIFGYSFAFFTNGLLGLFLRTKVYRDFYRAAFQKLVKVPYNFFENRSMSSITYSIDCIDIINDYYGANIINSLISAGAFAVLLIYVMTVSLSVFAILLFLIVFMGILLYLTNHRIVRMNQSEAHSREKLRGIQMEFVNAAEAVKLCGLESFFFKKWENRFDATLSKTKKKGIAQTIYTAISTIMQTIAPVILLLFCLSEAATSSLSIGTAVSLYSLSAMIVSYAVNVIESVNQIDRIELHISWLNDVLHQHEEANGTQCIDDIDSIVMQNVSFKYSLHSPYILKNINMRFEKGKKIAIVGESGSGKSTIAKLLIQLYPPSEGSIYYNGIRSDDIDKTTLKKVLNVVPQNGEILNMSVRENLFLFNDSHSAEEMSHVCKMTCIYEDIMQMPMKFETRMSNIGSNISGGQKQRLILARALLSNAKLLILDEATSSLDSITEQAIFQALETLNCTQIIITHRLTNVLDADHIYVIDHGEIVEQGTHKELIGLNGQYYKLYSSQLGTER